MQGHRFVFVRHAQAECNVLDDDELVPASQAEAALTERGRRQADALAVHLPAELRGARILCSPMRRARDTAAALAAVHRLEVQLDHRLAEFAVREPFEAPMRQRDWDRMLERRLEQPDRPPLPGVESLDEQFCRTQAFLRDRHTDRGDEAVTLVVSHAFTIELAILALLGLAPNALQRCRLRVSNTGVHVVENERWGGAARLLLVNALSHLDRWI